MAADDLIQFPFKRLTWAGIDNPLFVDDVLAANQEALAGLAALAGLGNTDFAIVGGLDYQTGPPGNYLPGVFFLNGNFYYSPAVFQEGNYLTIITTPMNPEGFSDGQTRNTYTSYTALATPVQPAAGNGTPIFSGDMSEYRIDNKYLAQKILFLLTVAATLGNAAYLNVGQVAGTVMAGDDPRAPYTAAQLDLRYAQRINVIEKGTATAYTPVNPNDPVNKNYVDTSFIKKLASGSVNLGDADTSGGTLHTISLGITLPDLNYRIIMSIGSLNANHNIDIFNQVTWCNKTTTSFGVWFKEQQSGVQNVQLDWSLESL